MLNFVSTTALLHTNDWRVQGVARVPTRLTRAEPCVIGRSSGNTVVIQAGDVARRHAAISFSPTAGWLLEDWGSTNGVLVNGARTSRVALTDGLAFSVASHAFRFELTSTTHLFDETLEDALFDAPERDEAWLIYADWLQEHGNPLGEHLMRAPQGHASLDGVTGYVTPSWTRGLLTGALLRGHVGGPGSPSSVLRELHNAPAARFLMRLEVELPSFVNAEHERATLQAMTQTLVELPFRGLSQVLLKLHRPAEVDAFDALQAKLRSVSPRAVVTQASLAQP